MERDHHPRDYRGLTRHRTRRLRRIEGRWSTAGFHWGTNRWWRTRKRAHSSLVVGCSLAIVLLPLDTASWEAASQDILPFDGLSAIPDSVFRLWATLHVLSHALIIDGVLAWRTPDNLAVKGWVRVFRTLLSGVPLLGLYAIDFWQWILGQRSRWAFDAEYAEADSHRAPPLGTFDRATAWILARPSAGVLVAVWLHAGNLLLLLVWSCRLSAPHSTNGATHEAFVYQSALHLLVCCCLLDVQGDYVRTYVVVGWRRTWLWTLPLLSLPLLFPFALLAVLGVVGYDRESGRAKTLCRMAYFHEDSAHRLATYVRLQEALDESPAILRRRSRIIGVGRSEIPGLVGRRLTAVYRLKTFLLGVDALALGWLLGRSPDVALVTCLLLGAGAACLLVVSRTLVRYLRPHRPTRIEAHGYGALLALGLVFAVAGLYVGAWLRQGQGQLAGFTVVYLVLLSIPPAAFGVLLGGFFKRFEIYREDRHNDAVWGVFFFALGLLGGIMALDPERATAYTEFISGTALLVPVWHLILAALFQSWLLRPYGLPRLLDRRYPRGRLAFLLITLALPLGGLAVPYWVFTRHQGWPSHDPIRERSGP